MGEKTINKNIIGADVVRPTYPYLAPEKNVGRYYESKAEDNKLWILPQWDLPRQEPSMDLIYARRELYDASTKLEIKRAEYEKEREVLDAEWNDLVSKEESLRKNFIMFHRFVKENKEKKERAQRRIAEEHLIHERRDEEINVIKEKISKLSDVRCSLEESVRKLKMYEDYLSNVVTISPEYRSISSVLNRYDALNAARNDLISRQKEGLEELEKARIEMMHLVEERVGAFMGLNNKIANYQSNYEKAKLESRYWENVVYKVKTTSARELLKIYLVLDSIWNLYVQMCIRKGVPVEIKKKDVEDQLIYIKNTINEYKRITKIAAKKSDRELGSFLIDSAKSNMSL